MKKKDIKIDSPINGHPKLSVAVYATAGEVLCSFSVHERPNEDRAARASSPVHNPQNKAVAFVRTFEDLAKNNVLTFAVVNTSTAEATGRIEI